MKFKIGDKVRLVKDCAKSRRAKGEMLGQFKNIPKGEECSVVYARPHIFHPETEVYEIATGEGEILAVDACDIEWA